MRNPDPERSPETGSEEQEKHSPEAESNLEREIAAGEWQRLKNFETYRRRTRQGKILAMYQAVSNRLSQLTGIFAHLVADDPAGAQKLLVEIKQLRRMQDFLSQCLIWEKQGEDIIIPDDLTGILE
jgi:hypothetical protein